MEEDIKKELTDIAKEVRRNTIELKKQHVTLREHMRRTSNLEDLLLPFYYEKEASDKVWKRIGKVAAFLAAIGGLVKLALEIY